MTKLNQNQERILEILSNSQEDMTALQIAEKGDFSNRTFVSKHLRLLKEAGMVVDERRGKNIFYTTTNRMVVFDQELSLMGLSEDKVWEVVAKNERLIKHTSENVRGVLYYAFTEMLNNAIDHSESDVAQVKVEIKGGKLRFMVRDYGVGVFRNIMQNKHLADEEEAIQELMKGKATTAPTAHSGEGIFWTSKIAEFFRLKSYEYSLLINNEVKDYTIALNEDLLKGTEVLFEVVADTKMSLEDFFGQYMSEENDYAFDTTVVHVNLYRSGEVWISRSQAKRVLVGLERYRRVILDFSGVELVGQAFCDEIFRVFRYKHPEIKLEPINMNKSVEMMVRRASSDTTGEELFKQNLPN